tara:strand:+ start:5289 stop:5501 length:213 start_codon:yes stop_codon:yes gene_type:complete
MALSTQVEEGLRAAEKELRETLAFAARAEKPYIVREIGGMISHIDNLLSTDNLFDRMDKVINDLEKERDD